MTYAEITYKIPSNVSKDRTKLIHKNVDSEKEMNDVIDRLDSRIKTGTCFGYIVTILNKSWK